MNFTQEQIAGLNAFLAPFLPLLDKAAGVIAQKVKELEAQRATDAQPNPSDAKNTEYLTFEQACRYTNVCKSVACELIKSGAFPAPTYQPSKRKRFWSKESLDAFKAGAKPAKPKRAPRPKLPDNQ